MKYDDHCCVCGRTLDGIEQMIAEGICSSCIADTMTCEFVKKDAAWEKRMHFIMAGEHHRQIEGWLLGPPTAADERARAHRIEELLAA